MTRKYITAQEVKKLLERDGIYGSIGNITINLLGNSVQIKQKDIIGNALQEWLGNYLRREGYYLRESTGQTFPDFYFSEDDTENLCEMKSFLNGRSPAFDIAFFSAYIESLRTHPHRLDSDYLIFSYDMDEEGALSITNIWCKKVWEITGPTKEYALNCQRKRGQIVNIRPVNWFSDSAKNRPFGNKVTFLNALYETYKEFTHETKVARKWIGEVITGYCAIDGSDPDMFESMIFSSNRE